MNNELAMWDDNQKLEEIRKLFAPTLTELEFQYFVGLGKATGLNPFTREIWCVKYGKDKQGKENPAQVFIGRDGYRKAAQSHSDYDYHQADAVYENDEFEVFNGEIKHKYKLTNRGKLMGAYCVTKRHKSSKPHYIFADLEEYNTGQSLWAEPTWKENSYGGKYKLGGKPATMIKKVAESQCLRAAFQDLLGGTYGEEESESMHINELKESRQNKSESLMNKLKAAKGQTIDVTPEPTEEPIIEPVTQEQLDEMEMLMSVKIFEPGRLKGALLYYKADSLEQLTKEQADDFIEKLNKLDDK